ASFDDGPGGHADAVADQAKDLGSGAPGFGRQRADREIVDQSAVEIAAPGLAVDRRDRWDRRRHQGPVDELGYVHRLARAHDLDADARGQLARPMQDASKPTLGEGLD